MFLKAAICEDDPVQRRNLQRLMEEWGESRNRKVMLSSYDTCEAFLESWSKRMDYDLLLLDIDLGGGMGGMELARRIRKKDERLAILFITGLAEYMSQGYDVQAFHFLVKPVEEEKIRMVLDKAVKALGKKEEYLLLEGETETERIPISTILYGEAFSHTVELHLASGAGRDGSLSIEVKMCLGDLEARLPEDEFIRCHRSYLVHLPFIRKIEKSQVHLDHAVSVPVSRERRKALCQAFLDYNKGRLV